MAHSTKTSAEKRRRQSDLVIVPYEEGRFDPSSTVAKYSSQHGKKPEPMVAEDGPTGSKRPPKVGHTGDNDRNLTSYGGKSDWTGANLTFFTNGSPNASQNRDLNADAPPRDNHKPQQEAQKETRGHGFDDCVEHKGNNKGGYVTYETENVFHKVNASFQ
ncbi:hypothetical protein LTR92_005149 [Exophiala xenobiotica]|uniref:Uncharacterized protein n=1 Tax=Vermiconidia calcicola TaxID=1690605 RepID=A0AAV9Q7R2_9PEZI|nr:hypothetical protein LTR92_005149 [Exophiala xenobiotica]KAK5536893.1 hypothetical protein LTR25_005568 [Vermiconidia calcicola]KAK5543038.1 hypothetical protein LTR23_005079 [Chaetothyriales sp. CCFEE 6169]KAK5340977.1 hypothetical protein LTR98_001769 [Exophiala xenobiotica]KAK5425511.1 hypothetical protein LTR34_011029 [Exophiala xenobiotica]